MISIPRSSDVSTATEDDRDSTGRIPAHSNPEDLQVSSPAEGAHQVHVAKPSGLCQPPGCTGHDEGDSVAHQRAKAKDGKPRKARSLADHSSCLAGQ